MCQKAIYSNGSELKIINQVKFRNGIFNKDGIYLIFFLEFELKDNSPDSLGNKKVTRNF